MAEKGEKLSEADVVENTVKAWLGNPISRSLLKLVSARGKNGSRLDLALRKYAGENVNLGFADKISYLIVKTAISKGSKPFNISKEEIKLFLKEPFVRRGVTNIIEGVAHFGVQRPQTCAVPFLIVWDFTHACNLKCKHCYQEADKTMPDELSTEEAKKAIDQLAEAGVPAIAFSGGEPLTRKDFFEVAKYAKEKEFYVSLATNGTLITKEVAQKLKKIVDYVEISMDGFESMHDNFRGIRGVWKMTYKGIKNCVDVGLDTCVATTVTKWNLEDIPKLIDFVEKDLKANRMIFFNFIPTRRGKNIADQDITPEEREKLLKFLYSKLIDKKSKLDVFSTAPQYARVACEYFSGGPSVMTHFTDRETMDLLKGRTEILAEFIGGCGCARLYAALEPNGDIFPCVFLPVKVGNIREQNLRDIWLNSETLKKLRDRDAFEGCGSCKYKKICGGCRARAYGYFGDLQGPDPGCIVNLKYWNKIKNK